MMAETQAPLFHPDPKGAWIMRFEGIVADAMEEGPPEPLPETVIQSSATRHGICWYRIL